MFLSRIRCSLGAAAALAACAAIALHPGPARAQAAQEKLPTAEEICDRYVEATGGIKAYDAINNRITRATVDIPSQGIKMDMTVYSARPNLQRWVIESEVFGKIEKGCDGKIAWENSLMAGPSVKQGDERAVMLQSAVFDRFAHWRSAFSKAECTGSDDISGSQCYRVVLTPSEGDPLTLWFDRDSGLLMKVRSMQVTPQGKIPVETAIGDYREVDGILFAHRSTVSVMGQERIVETTSIENNAQMPEGIFDPPAEIKKIMAAGE